MSAGAGGAGEWEVVGRGKKGAGAGAGAQHNGTGKPGGNKKKAAQGEPAPRLEELFPPAQIKSMYTAMQAEEEKKTGGAKEIKKKDVEQKKQPKKEKQPEKKPEVAAEKKPKAPKSVEGALQAIDVSELANLINTNKARFANAPLVWLKEIANYINTKTPVEVSDVVFSNHSVHYPMNIVPLEIRKTLEGVLQEAGKQNTQLFYDITLTAMANDMSRGQSAIGHKVLLQMVAQENPEFCVSSIQKSVSLRNSYQNRPPIGLSLLWAFGQGGFKNFAVGLQAWQDLILPQLELRNYAKYTVTYISKLLDKHSKMDSAVTQEQFLNMLDLVNSKRQGLSRELSAELIKQISKFRKLYFARNTGKFQVTFNQVLKKLPNQYVTSNNLDAFQKELVDILIECLERDDSCNATWRQLYQKCTKQSVTLLHYIDSNWGTFGPRLKLEPLKATALYFREQNALKKKDELAEKSDALCQEMVKKMKKSTRKFPWLFASFVLLCGIIAAVITDVTLAGGVFSKSSTGKFLDSIGVLEHSEKAWEKSMAASARGYIWVEQNAPVYYTRAAEISKPYAQLGRDLYIITSKQVGVMFNNTREYVVEKAPVVYATVDQYAPGLLTSIADYSSAGYTAVCNFTGVYFNSAKDYLHTRVFVGEWAPEILQDKTLKALNVTRVYVAQNYDWFRKQVDVYSKLQ